MGTPGLSRLGTASAWIIGRLEQSPIIEIDESRSDFVENDQLHIFMQEIEPEKLENFELLINQSINPESEAAE